MLNIMDNKNFKNMDPYSASTGVIEINPELRNIGYADGINIEGPLSQEKNEMIKLASKNLGNF